MELSQGAVFKMKLCWVLFILLNLITLALMLMTLFSEKWVSLASQEELISFEGGIMSFHSASLNLEEYQDKPYEEAAEDWCNGEDSEEDYYKAGCALFSGLAVTCWFFVVFEILAAAYTISNIVALSVFFCHKNILGLSLFSVVLSSTWQFFAFLFYSGANNLTFTGNCDKFRNRDNPENLCAEDGPLLALALFCFMVIIGIFQCVFIGLALNLDKNKFAIVKGKVIPYPGCYSNSPPAYSSPPGNFEVVDLNNCKELGSPGQEHVSNGRPTMESDQRIIDPRIRFESPPILADDNENSQ